MVVGWSAIGRLLLEELARHVSPGSTALLLVHGEAVSDEERAAVDRLEQLDVEWQEVDTTAPEPLRQALAGDDVDHVILLCGRDTSTAESDARTLMTLLQVRQLIRTSARRPSVVTELLDIRDLELARSHYDDDFIVSEHLSSLMMVQLAENPELAAVFADLFDGEGTDLSLKPAPAYVAPNGPVPFADMVRTARDRGEAAIGYRAGGEVVLNPPKSRPVALGEGDHLVVLTPADKGLPLSPQG